MISIFLLLLLLLFSLITGLLLTRHLNLQGGWGEQIFASISLSLLLIGLISFILAEFSLFSLPTVLTIFLLLTFTLYWKSANLPTNHPTKEPFHPIIHPILFFALLGTVWLFGRPHEYITGGSDAGSYINLAQEIANNGSILIEDSVLAELDPALYPHLLRTLPEKSYPPYYIMPAFYVMSDIPGEITPQFYHLHPVWLAIVSSFTNQIDINLNSALILNGLWTILSFFALYLLAKKLFPTAPFAPLILFLLLISNSLQIWFARYPTSEPLSQFLLWTALWAVSCWFAKPNSSRFYPFLAGLAFGELFLTRIDAIFFIPIFALFAVWLWGTKRWESIKSAPSFFFVPLTLLIIHAFLHAITQSRPYFWELMDNIWRVGLKYWEAPLLILILAVTLLYLIRFKQSWLAPFYQKERPLRILLLFSFLTIMLFFWFGRPYLASTPFWNDPYSQSAVPIINHDNLRRLGWYISPLIIWLAIVGISKMLWDIRPQTALLLALTLFQTIFYLWNIRTNPHQIYTMRRYLPTTIPLFYLALLSLPPLIPPNSFKKIPNRVAIHLPNLLLLLLIPINLSYSRGLITHQDFLGMSEQLASLNTQFEPNSILLFADPAPVGQGDFFGTPLRFIYQHHSFTVRNLEELDPALLAKTIDLWHNNGYPIYWIGDPTWLQQYNHPFIREADFTLTASQLESTYDRRPTTILNHNWTIQIQKLKQK